MRSLVCCGVSTTVCARVEGDPTRIPTRAMWRNSNAAHPVCLVACGSMTPSGLYRHKAQVHQGIPEL